MFENTHAWGFTPEQLIIGSKGKALVFLKAPQESLIHSWYWGPPARVGILSSGIWDVEWLTWWGGILEKCVCYDWAGKDLRLKGMGDGELRGQEREVGLLLWLLRIWINLVHLLLRFWDETRGWKKSESFDNPAPSNTENSHQSWTPEAGRWARSTKLRIFSSLTSELFLNIFLNYYH